LKNLSLPSTRQDLPTDFSAENIITDMQIRASLELLFKQGSMIAREGSVFVIYLPPGTVSKVGPLYGPKHFVAYHDHYNTEGGRVNYAVIPFDPDSHRREETVRRVLIQAILNPVGDGWY